jgi:hypothetical protein
MRCRAEEEERDLEELRGVLAKVRKEAKERARIEQSLLAEFETLGASEKALSSEGAKDNSFKNDDADRG